MRAPHDCSDHSGTVHCSGTPGTVLPTAKPQVRAHTAPTYRRHCSETPGTPLTCGFATVPLFPLLTEGWFRNTRNTPRRSDR